MTEIKILAKIALLAYGICCLLFGVMYISIPETLIANLMPGWEVNAFHPRVLGGFLVVIGIWGILMILYKGWEWENIEVAYLGMFSFILPMLIGQLLTLVLLPVTAAFVAEMMFEVPLESGLFILGMLGFWKQRT